MVNLCHTAVCDTNLFISKMFFQPLFFAHPCAPPALKWKFRIRCIVLVISMILFIFLLRSLFFRGAQKIVFYLFRSDLYRPQIGVFHVLS